MHFGTPAPYGGFAPLDPARAAVARAVGDRRQHAEMARRLYLSEKTVRNYASALYAKIGASSRSEAVLIARARQRE